MFKETNIFNTVTEALTIVGGLNWGLISLFNFNLVTAIFGLTPITQIVYGVVGACALMCLLRMLGILPNRTTIGTPL